MLYEVITDTPETDTRIVDVEVTNLNLPDEPDKSKDEKADN